MKDKKVTKIRQAPKALPLLKEIISDYKTLSNSDLRIEILQLFFDKNIDQKHLLRLLQTEISQRLDLCKKDNKKQEVSLCTFQALMKKTEVEIKFNMMTHRVEIICPHIKNIEILGLAEEQRFLCVKELCRSFNFPTYLAGEYIKLSAKAYHPVKEWIHSKDWDFTNRGDLLFDTLDCQNENQELAKQFLWKWSVQAVRAVLSDKGQASEMVLVLKGKQAAGKTRWFRSLAPDDFVKTGLQLNPNNKDSLLEANTSWINELGELDGMTRKTDHANLKAHFSKTDDYIRRPYAVTEERIPRKSVYGATVNSDSFLVDDTGNRRYLILEVGEINHNHKIDMQQYWHEIYHEAKFNNVIHWLDESELKAQQNLSEKFRMVDPLVQSIQMKGDELTANEYWVKEIIRICCEIDNPTSYQCKVVKQYLLGEGWIYKSKGKGTYRMVKPKDFGLGVKPTEDMPF